MACDMCGAKTKLFRALIEGTEMSVCRDCSKFGKILGEIRTEFNPKSKSFVKKEIPKRNELIQVMVDDFAKTIKDAREQKNLTQKEFAQKISEKESLIHKLETGSFDPSISLARKIEKFLGIKIVEQYEEETSPQLKQQKSEEFTLGDFIKIKKKKK